MNGILQKLSVLVGSSTVLALSFIAPVEALILNISGRFADTSSCTVEGPPRDDFRCLVQDLEGGSFTGTIDVDDPNTEFSGAVEGIKFFDKFGNDVTQENFARGLINLSEGKATLSLFSDFGVFQNNLTLNFLPPQVPNPTNPFGAFTSGGYRKQEGASLKIFQSIDVVSATISDGTIPTPSTD